MRTSKILEAAIRAALNEMAYEIVYDVAKQIKKNNKWLARRQAWDMMRT